MKAECRTIKVTRGLRRSLAVCACAATLLHGAPAEDVVDLKGHQGSVLCLAASPQRRFGPAGDFTLLASGGADGTLQLWEIAWVNRQTSGKEIRSLAGHAGAVTSVAFSADGLTLASGGADGSVRLWNVASGSELGTLHGHAGEVTAVLFAPDGKLLASAGADGYVRLWEASIGKERQAPIRPGGPIRSLAQSDDGKLLASGGDDGHLRLWSLPEGRELRTLRGHTAAVRSVAFNPNGSAVVSGGADGTVRMWERSTGEQVRTLHGHAGPVESVAFTRDGSLVASGSADGTVRFWAAHNGLALRTLRAPAVRPVRTLAFFWRGNGLAIADDGGTLALWEVGLKKEIRLPDGRTVTSQSGLRPQQVIFILDTESGRLQRIGPGGRPVWSPDGRFLAFGSESHDQRDSGYSIWDGTDVRRHGRSSSAPVAMTLGSSFLVVAQFGRFDDKGDLITGDVPQRLVIHELVSGATRTLNLAAKRRGREQWAQHSGPFAVAPSGEAIAIVFQAGRGDLHIHPRILRSEVAVVRPDGSLLRRIQGGAPLRFLTTGELAIEDQSAFPVPLDAISLDTGGRRRLFTVPSRFFDLSADGRLAYMAYEKEGKAVWVWDAGGSPRRLTDGEFPALSADGSRVAFGRRGPDRYKGQGTWEAALYVARIADGVVRRYELAGAALAPPEPSESGGFWAWAPDGRRVALTLEEPPP